MFVRQQPAVPAAPATPAAPRTTTKVPQDASPIGVQVAPARLAGLSYNQLRAIRDELASQRQTLAERRGAIAREYERSSGANRDGIASRLIVLDKNIVTLEDQLAEVGQRMAAVRPETSVPPSRNPTDWSSDKVANLGFSLVLGTALVTAYVMRRFSRRRAIRTPETSSLAQGASNERLDRIEQAVDTIAVEIERVSENQRFMTRLMTETQLAGTIAAVRSSAEAAKSEVDAKT
jgi:hypothetical protein